MQDPGRTPLSLETSTRSALAELGLLREGWDDLVRAMPRPSPFLLHAWIEAWARHHLRDGELRVHTVACGGILLGAAPFCIRRRKGLRMLEFIGGNQSALADLLLAPDATDEVVRGLAGAVAGSGHDLAVLFGLPAHSRLAGAFGGQRLRLIERVEAPVLDLDPDWQTVYREKTSSKRRALHKRRMRQLRSLGRVEVRVARTPDELERALEEALVLHRLRWAGRPDGSGFATPTGMAFHREAIQALAEQDIPRIVTLAVDGKPIAFHYYLAFCGRMYVHRLAFDPALARFSPGLMATLEAVRVAAEEGLGRVEFLGGGERYKLELADRNEPLYQGLGLAATLRGRLAADAAARSILLRKRLKRSETLHRAYLGGLAPRRRLAVFVRRAG